MSKVLDHRKSPLTPSGIPLVFQHPYIFSAAAILLVLFDGLTPANAQVLLNGQTFTSGLAIIDSPNPGSTYHAGSNMPIAIDVSGDGQLPASASLPGSGQATSYDSLEIYLISYQTNTNLTVSSGTSLLTQESGSTVKHLDYFIPTCVQPGSYNLTFYETAHIHGIPFFTISPISVEISNPGVSGACSNLNSLLGQPQASSPSPQNPFLPPTEQGQPSTTQKGQNGSDVIVTALTVTSGGSITTITETLTNSSKQTPSGMATVVTGAQGGLTTVPGLITVTISSSGAYPWPLSPSALTGPTQAVTVDVGPAGTSVSVTVVVISMETVTSTQPGQTKEVTTTVTTVSTTTAVMNAVDPNGLVPVNTASSVLAFASVLSLVWLFSAWTLFFF